MKFARTAISGYSKSLDISSMAQFIQNQVIIAIDIIKN